MRQSYTYTNDDLRTLATHWAEGKTLIQIATLMKRTAKEADAMYHSAKKRGLLKPRHNRLVTKRRTVKVSEQLSAQQKLIATVDAEAHKMGQVAKFAWEVLRSSL